MVNRSYCPYLGSILTCDMFSLHEPIGASKVPAIQLSLKCLRVGREMFQTFQLKGLAQLVLMNVAEHLACSMPTSARLKYVWVRYSSVH